MERLQIFGEERELESRSLLRPELAHAIIESRPANLLTSAMVPCAWLNSFQPKVL
jgi:hypothetical protein